MGLSYRARPQFHDEWSSPDQIIDQAVDEIAANRTLPQRSRGGVAVFVLCTEPGKLAVHLVHPHEDQALAISAPEARERARKLDSHDGGDIDLFTERMSTVNLKPLEAKVLARAPQTSADLC